MAERSPGHTRDMAVDGIVQVWPDVSGRATGASVFSRSVLFRKVVADSPSFFTWTAALPGGSPRLGAQARDRLALRPSHRLSLTDSQEPSNLSRWRALVVACREKLPYPAGM